MSIIKKFLIIYQKQKTILLRLSTDLDMFKNDSKLTFGYRKFFENEWNKNFDIYSSDN